MRAAEDLEKGSPVVGSESAAAVNASDLSGDESPRVEQAKETTGGRHRPGQIRPSCPYDSDPYEARERVSTPDLQTETEAGQAAARESISRVRTGASAASDASRAPDFEVTFEPGDPSNPKNFPRWYRGWVIFCVSISTWVVVLYSTSYTSSMSGLMEEYHEPSQTVATLGVTTYLLGLAAGSLVVAPLSELFGRRPVYLACLAVFALLIIPSCLATSLAEIIIVRFFGALFGAALVANGPGTIVDIASEEHRALCMSLYSIAPMNGPVSGPIVGGFVFQYIGWRWVNWISLMLAGAAVLVMATVKETYAPSVLRGKAAQLRRETGDGRWWCRYDQRTSTAQLLVANLSRPFVLSFTEPILWFFNVWISLVYGILYLCFVAYPVVFTEHRGWGPGDSGLSFLGIGIGTIGAIACEPLWRRIINSHAKDPETGRAPPEATAAIMCISSILTPVGQLVFSWTCLPVTIHWAVPVAFGIPFGMGNTLAFIYGSNYLAGAYGIFAASALAGNTVMRSVFGATLPLAGPTMYSRLTPQWAGTLLGLLEVCLIPIPFIFYRHGQGIRARSGVIGQMREDLARDQARRARQTERLESRARREKLGSRARQEEATTVDRSGAAGGVAEA